MTFYHKQIVNWLTPAGTWLRDRSWGWIIAVLIIIALSTPPLFGNEVRFYCDSWKGRHERRMKLVWEADPDYWTDTFSHMPQIVLVLVGLVWGLWKGFGIAIMGTVLGEVLNFL